jgi:hydrogenase maturation protease
MRRVTLLVCGEPMRGDDAVADRIVGQLPATTRALAEVCHVGALMPDDLIGAGSPVIVVDAVHGLPAGSVIDLPIEALGELVEAGVAPGSTHALPLPMVLGLVEQLAGGLPEGRFVGVAGAAYGLGAPLSQDVVDALAPAAARLGHWIRVLAHARRLPACA